MISLKLLAFLLEPSGSPDYTAAFLLILLRTFKIALEHSFYEVRFLLILLLIFKIVLEHSFFEVRLHCSIFIDFIIDFQDCTGTFFL